MKIEKFIPSLWTAKVGDIFFKILTLFQWLILILLISYYRENKSDIPIFFITIENQIQLNRYTYTCEFVFKSFTIEFLYLKNISIFFMSLHNSVELIFTHCVADGWLPHSLDRETRDFYDHELNIMQRY